MICKICGEIFEPMECSDEDYCDSCLQDIECQECPHKEFCNGRLDCELWGNEQEGRNED